VYQFPENSKIYSHSNLFLANDPEVFHKKYGFTSFGQFTRNLSDKGQDLMLVDGYGNIIDDVSYTDTIPWPDADGNGYFLKLKDVNLDNSLASNWTASNEALFDDQSIPDDLQMLIFPNPTSDQVKILNGYEIKSITVFDISGRPIQTIEVNSKELVLDMKKYPRGVYLIRAATLNGTVTGKIVKE
jgi:hypothetical protein